MKTTMNVIRAILSGTILILLLTACSKQAPKYVIGVSQCSEDIWRDKLNDELQTGTYFHDGVELRFASADDSSLTARPIPRNLPPISVPTTSRWVA